MLNACGFLDTFEAFEGEVGREERFPVFPTGELLMIDNGKSEVDVRRFVAHVGGTVADCGGAGFDEVGFEFSLGDAEVVELRIKQGEVGVNVLEIDVAEV